MLQLADIVEYFYNSFRQDHICFNIENAAVRVGIDKQIGVVNIIFKTDIRSAYHINIVKCLLYNKISAAGRSPTRVISS